jgi:hypothetical protein
MFDGTPDGLGTVQRRRLLLALLEDCLDELPDGSLSEGE